MSTYYVLAQREEGPEGELSLKHKNVPSFRVLLGLTPSQTNRAGTRGSLRQVSVWLQGGLPQHHPHGQSAPDATTLRHPGSRLARPPSPVNTHPVTRIVTIPHLEVSNLASRAVCLTA